MSDLVGNVTNVEKELLLQSLIGSFQVENISISEERARAILEKVELSKSK